MQQFTPPFYLYGLNICMMEITNGEMHYLLQGASPDILFFSSQP